MSVMSLLRKFPLGFVSAEIPDLIRANRKLKKQQERLENEGILPNNPHLVLPLSVLLVHQAAQVERLRLLESKARGSIVGVTLVLSVYFPAVALLGSAIKASGEALLPVAYVIFVFLLFSISYFATAGVFGLLAMRPTRRFVTTLNDEIRFQNDNDRKLHALWCTELNVLVALITTNRAAVSINCIRNGIVVTILLIASTLWLSLARPAGESQPHNSYRPKCYVNSVEVQNTYVFQTRDESPTSAVCVTERCSADPPVDVLLD